MNSPVTLSTVFNSNAPLINPERLWQSLMDLAQLGATAKGGPAVWPSRTLTVKPGIYLCAGVKTPVAASVLTPSAISSRAVPVVKPTWRQS